MQVLVVVMGSRVGGGGLVWVCGFAIGSGRVCCVYRYIHGLHTADIVCVTYVYMMFLLVVCWCLLFCTSGAPCQQRSDPGLGLQLGYRVSDDPDLSRMILIRPESVGVEFFKVGICIGDCSCAILGVY